MKADFVYPLSAEEEALKTECDAIIRRGTNFFLEMGQALMTVRDRQLYRTTHTTFDEYCEAAYGFTLRHAQRLIDSTRVVDQLKAISGPAGHEIYLPANEAQTRQLVPLLDSPDELVKVWLDVTAKGKPTAAALRKRREELPSLDAAPPQPSDTAVPAPAVDVGAVDGEDPQGPAALPAVEPTTRGSSDPAAVGASVEPGHSSGGVHRSLPEPAATQAVEAYELALADLGEFIATAQEKHLSGSVGYALMLGQIRGELPDRPSKQEMDGLLRILAAAVIRIADDALLVGGAQ